MNLFLGLFSSSVESFYNRLLVVWGLLFVVFFLGSVATQGEVFHVLTRLCLKLMWGRFLCRGRELKQGEIETSECLRLSSE